MTMTITMSAATADQSKPPRPCTEYNIFFQLERAYILQLLLRAPPSLDLDSPADAFHARQPTYAGHPPLPGRYAALVLPYDWHLPGKELRRKRKHRKSHGVIGFHELSRQVVAAWRVVDDEVKAFCAQVSAVGMARYKADSREWKAKNKNKRPTTITAMENSASPMATNNEDETEPAQLLSNKQTTEDSTATAAEMNQAFEEDVYLESFVNMDTEDILGTWDAQQESSRPSPSPSASTEAVCSADIDSQTRNDRNARHAPAAASIQPVDMDDSEIIDMWNNAHGGANWQHRRDRALSPSPSPSPSRCRRHVVGAALSHPLLSSLHARGGSA